MAGDQVQNKNPLSVPGRRSPQQERSKKTVGMILDATLELLERESFGGVTMQKIADRADINVAAVYGYFPNKHQVIAELYDRMFSARNEARAEIYKRLLLREGPWVDNFVEALREIVEWQSNQRGRASVQNAMRASPSLRQLQLQYLDKAIDQMAHHLSLVNPDFEGDQRLRARVITETVTELSDALQMSKARWPSPLGEETIKMVRSYLRAA